MSFATFLLAPLALMVPSAGAVDVPQDMGPTPYETAAADHEGDLRRAAPVPADREAVAWPFRLLIHGFSAELANQVRIEQRMTIRVAPRAQLQPDMFADLPDREIGPRFVERKIGKCLPVARISGVQTNGANRLLLFMRDQRIVSAELERACQARDFYSGFYLSRSDDGMLCIDRDTLLSRSGANCKLTRIRQLVETD